MNILEIEDTLKGIPDEALIQEAQAPSGGAPQYLVISEIQRRSDMRERFAAEEQQSQNTVLWPNRQCQHNQWLLLR